MPEIYEPLPKWPTLKELLPAYQKADKRSIYYYTKARFLGDTDEAKTFRQAGDDQIDLLADIHNRIVRTKPGDLADVHAKLVVMMDSLRLRSVKEDTEMLELKMMLEQVIEWVAAMVSCADENEPVEIQQIQPENVNKAA